MVVLQVSRPPASRIRVLTRTGGSRNTGRTWLRHKVEGERLFFKIDYYDQSLLAHSPDSSDENVTKRVLTIMLAEEY